MARITSSLYTSHIPAVGAAFDLGKTKEDYWKPVFAGYDFTKQWETAHIPDVIFLVYNDHATAFSLQMIPTFAIMTGPEFNPADEGYGARPVPKVIGHPELASHIASEVIQQDFDLTMVNEIDVDDEVSDDSPHAYVARIEEVLSAAAGLLDELRTRLDDLESQGRL